MTLTLIIATYEQPEALDKVLCGVSLQTRPPDEIFIADDGSGEDTRRVIEHWRSALAVPLHHLWHEHNGFRKVILLNRAVAAAEGDYLVFTDGDCVPERHFLADHESLAERGFWVQGRRCNVHETCVPDYQPGRSRYWSWALRGRLIGCGKGLRLPVPIVLRNQRQRGIIGCNMAFWRDDVLAVNGFDEEFLGRGIAPDSDLGTRVYNLGRRRKFVYGRAIVYHLNHPVLPRENMSAKRTWLQETIRTRRTRCRKGVDQYLSTAVDSPNGVA